MIEQSSETLNSGTHLSQQALASLYDQHATLVYSVALRILRSPPCAQDVLQEVFLQIWRRPHQFQESRGEFSAWVATVTRHRCIDMLRSRRPAEPIENFDPADPNNLALTAEASLMCEKVKAIALTLPPKQRHMLDLAYFEGMTQQEIADRTGYPLGTVKSRIRSALLSLRHGLEPEKTAPVSPAPISSLPYLLAKAANPA